jgi:two-component system nitrogen regulation sensor histidine kinase GlnL
MLGSNTLLDIQALNIHEILERTKQLILADSNQQINITRDYDPSTPNVFGDKSQLIQAVLNIAKNAMQALQRSNTQNPCIGFKTRVLRQLTIGSQLHRLVCHVEISDNGPGIPEQLQNTLFLPMVSGRPEGTGLGLSIAQTIINHHQGLIEYDSQQGQTTFSIFIPIETTAKQEHDS